MQGLLTSETLKTPLASVLIVDDEPLFLDVISKTLRKRGFDVFPADGPREALATVTNQRPIDVVLSDVQTPAMRGTYLVREIAQVSPHTASILMTCDAVDLADVPRGVPLLRKPFSTEDLFHTVAEVLACSAQTKAERQRDLEENVGLRQQLQDVHSELRATILEIRAQRRLRLRRTGDASSGWPRSPKK